MLLLVSALLSVALAAGGIVYAVLRGLALWRRAKRVSGEFASATERISQATAQIEQHMQRAQAGSDRLRAAADRLQRSRAQLEDQVEAVSGAVSQVRRLLWFFPGA